MFFTFDVWGFVVLSVNDLISSCFMKGKIGSGEEC